MSPKLPKGRRARAVLGALCTVLALACGDGSGPGEDGEVAFVGLSGVPDNGKLFVSQTIFLVAHTYDHAHSLITGVPITWTTSDTTVAAVAPWGDGVVVTGVAPGRVIITATSQGERAVAQLSIEIIPVGEVRVSPAVGAAYAGMITQLSVTVLDSLGGLLEGRQVTWSSSDPGLASVDANGRVTVRGAGNVTITATSEGKSGLAELTLLPRPTANWSAVTEEWTTYQGNADHTGFVPATLDPVVFALAWERAVSPGTALNPAVEGAGRVFVSTDSYFGLQRAYALDAGSGAEQWHYDFGGIHSVDAPSFADGSVYLVTGGHEDSYIWAFDAAGGSIRFNTRYDNQWSRWKSPVVVGPTLYMGGGYYGGMYAFNTTDGTQRWFVELSQYDWFTPAVRDGIVYAFLGPSPTIRAVNASTGLVEYDIPTLETVGLDLDRTPVLGGLNDLLTGQGGRLISYDLANRQVGWTITGSFVGQVVVAEGVIYVVNDRNLEARQESDGTLLWSWPIPESGIVGTMIATKNLLFVTDGATTYAVDKAARLQAWSYPAGGHLALTRDGLLLIARADGTLTAVDVK